MHQGKEKQKWNRIKKIKNSLRNKINSKSRRTTEKPFSASAFDTCRIAINWDLSQSHQAQTERARSRCERARENVRWRETVGRLTKRFQFRHRRRPRQRVYIIDWSTQHSQHTHTHTHSTYTRTYVGDWERYARVIVISSFFVYFSAGSALFRSLSLPAFKSFFLVRLHILASMRHTQWRVNNMCLSFSRPSLTCTRMVISETALHRCAYIGICILYNGNICDTHSQHGQARRTRNEITGNELRPYWTSDQWTPSSASDRETQEKAGLEE